MAEIKISELEPTTDLEGLYTIGSDKNNLSKKVSLQFLREAADYAIEQGDYAKQEGSTIESRITDFKAETDVKLTELESEISDVSFDLKGEYSDVFDATGDKPTLKSIGLNIPFGKETTIELTNSGGSSSTISVQLYREDGSLWGEIISGATIRPSETYTKTFVPDINVSKINLVIVSGRTKYDVRITSEALKGLSNRVADLESSNKATNNKIVEINEKIPLLESELRGISSAIYGEYSDVFDATGDNPTLKSIDLNIPSGKETTIELTNSGGSSSTISVQLYREDGSLWGEIISGATIRPSETYTKTFVPDINVSKINLVIVSGRTKYDVRITSEALKGLSERITDNEKVINSESVLTHSNDLLFNLYDKPKGCYKVGMKDVLKFQDTEILGKAPSGENGYSEEFEAYYQKVISNNTKFTFAGAKHYDKMYDLKYYPLGISKMLLDITPDGKIWFQDDHKLIYYNSVEDIETGNYTTINHTFETVVAGLRMNSRGELIVVLSNRHLSVPVPIVNSIWKSDSNFENWTKKMEFDNKYVRFSYPDWGIDLQGERVIVTAYGGRGTDRGYLSEYEKACWSIYYSPDGGDTWYNKVFNAGRTYDVKGWSFEKLEGTSPISGISYPDYIRMNTHIHGCAIDPYRNRLMVFVGDYNRALYVTTNLGEWESNPNRIDGWDTQNDNCLHWMRLSCGDTGLGGGVQMKYVSGMALADCLLLGADALPNGLQRINLTGLENKDSEIALTESEWAFQITEGTGDYGYYGSTIKRYSPNSPILCYLMYIGGLDKRDKKRNMLYLSDDGYSFSKVWEDDRDLISLVDGKEVEVKSDVAIARMDRFGNILLTTKDGRWDESPADGYISNSYNHTLVIGKINK